MCNQSETFQLSKSEDGLFLPKLTEDIAYKIACELSHDLYEGLADRVRWNNYAMGIVLNGYEEMRQENQKLKQEIKNLSNGA